MVEGALASTEILLWGIAVYVGVMLLDFPGRGRRLIKEEVDEEDIAEIVSRWTGIPVSKPPGGSSRGSYTRGSASPRAIRSAFSATSST